MYYQLLSIFENDISDSNSFNVRTNMCITICIGIDTITSTRIRASNRTHIGKYKF